MGLAQFETLLLAGGVFLMEGCLLVIAGIIVWCVSPYLEYEKLNWRILSAAGCVPIMFF